MDSSVPAVPSATVDAVLDHALAAPARLGAGRLICVDGPAGSGKSTLAAAVLERARESDRAPGLSVDLLRMDDHYEGWAGLDGVDRRLRDEVLGPLAIGEPGMYRRYDWHAGAFAELHLVEPVDVLLLEGVGSGSSLLAAFRSTLVWVTAPEDVRLARWVARDGEATLPHRDRWTVDEARHFTAHDTERSADLRVGPTGVLLTPGDGGW